MGITNAEIFHFVFQSKEYGLSGLHRKGEFARKRSYLELGGGGGGFKNVYLLVNLGASKFSILNKNRLFRCMGKIFCVEFQRFPLKFHTNYLTHTFNDLYLIDMFFTSSWIYEVVSVFEMPPLKSCNVSVVHSFILSWWILPKILHRAQHYNWHGPIIKWSMQWDWCQYTRWNLIFSTTFPRSQSVNSYLISP